MFGALFAMRNVSEMLRLFDMSKSKIDFGKRRCIDVRVVHSTILEEIGRDHRAQHGLGFAVAHAI